MSSQVTKKNHEKSTNLFIKIAVIILFFILFGLSVSFLWIYLARSQNLNQNLNPNLNQNLNQNHGKSEEQILFEAGFEQRRHAPPRAQSNLESVDFPIEERFKVYNDRGRQSIPYKLDLEDEVKDKLIKSKDFSLDKLYEYYPEIKKSDVYVNSNYLEICKVFTKSLYRRSTGAVLDEIHNITQDDIKRCTKLIACVLRANLDAYSLFREDPNSKIRIFSYVELIKYLMNQDISSFPNDKFTKAFLKAKNRDEIQSVKESNFGATSRTS